MLQVTLTHGRTNTVCTFTQRMLDLVKLVPVTMLSSMFLLIRDMPGLFPMLSIALAVRLTQIGLDHARAGLPYSSLSAWLTRT